jgi:DNA-binding SARP family transcriptional activator
MSGDLRVQLFGAVAAWRGADPVQLGPAQQRAVFALLALAGRPVPRDELARGLWGDNPPRHAANVIQTHVKHLRHAVDPGRAARAPSDVLARAGDGYLLRIAAEDVDALRFRRLVADARAARRAGTHDELFRYAEEALRLWQGPPATDLPVLAEHPMVTTLTEERWLLVSWFAEAALRRGTPGEALAVVEEAVAARALDEPLHGWLIRLYYALGRRADALGGYARLGRRLAEDLGVDPAPELRALHEAVLREDPSLDAGPPVPVEVPAPRVPPAGRGGQQPRALPRDLVDFTGRTELLGDLLAAVPPVDRPGTAPVIHAIDGMPGVGKTTLAVHLAHLVADRYPDAQLYLDLHGHSEQAPLQPAAVVGALLRQLGVPGDRIPEEFDQRIALWRGELAGRRTLLLLDNAGTADQIAMLLPAEPGCLTLVTSRRRLTGLDGARPVSLGVLTADEAVTLQQRIVGDRVDAAPEAAQEVARHCGHLALAIRLAAARLAHRPGWTVSDLASRLGGARTPLRELALPGRTVEAAFALSYQDLSEPARRLFRLLGLHRGPDIDLRAAAALADLSVDDADEVLAELVDVHLLDEPAAERYRLHDLIRDYAAGLAADEPERDGAVDRLLTYYLHAALAADGWMKAFAARLDLHLGEPPPQVLPWPDHAAADRWLAADHPNLGASVRLAVETGRDALAWRLAFAAWRYLYIKGYTDECLALNELALSAAERAGEPHGVAVTLNNSGGAHFKRGHWDRALWYVDRAIEIRAGLDEPMLHASSLGNKAAVLQNIGDYPGALLAAEESLALYGGQAAVSEVSAVQVTIGQIYAWMGDYDEAERNYRALLDTTKRLRDVHLHNVAMGHLGQLRLFQGRFAEAIDLLADVIAGWSSKIPMVLAPMMSWLGLAECGLGRMGEGLGHLRAAVDLMVEHGEVPTESQSRIWYGIGLRAAGDLPGALEQFRLALDLADQLALPLCQALAADGMAEIQSGPDPEHADELRARAQAIYRRLGLVRPTSIRPERLGRTRERPGRI